MTRDSLITEAQLLVFVCSLESVQTVPQAKAGLITILQVCTSARKGVVG